MNTFYLITAIILIGIMVIVDWFSRDKEQDRKKDTKGDSKFPPVDSDSKSPSRFSQNDENLKTVAIKDSLTTWEEVKNSFSLQNFISFYQSGELVEWLKKIGERKKAERLCEFQIPKRRPLFKAEGMKLCEALFPAWKELPGRLVNELKQLPIEDEHAPDLSEERIIQFLAGLTHYVQSSLNLKKRSNGQNLICFMKEKVIQKVCMMSEKEIVALLEANTKEGLGRAAYQFMSSEPLFIADRNLRYVMDELENYIFSLVQFFYDTNIRQVKYEENGTKISFSIIFNDIQPMSDFHMIKIDDPFHKGNDAPKVFSGYCFNHEQLQSLLGLSRIEVAEKILNWLNEAHLVSNELTMKQKTAIEAQNGKYERGMDGDDRSQSSSGISLPKAFPANMKGNSTIPDSDSLIERLRIFWESMCVVKERINSDNSKLSNEGMLGSNSLASPLLPMMEALPHLHFPQGVVLDYLQEGDSMGSEPRLYVRKQNEPRAGDDHNTMLLGFHSLRTGSAPNITRFMDIVRPEPTVEGAWELFILNLLGTQFNLKWHANYHKLFLVYDWHDLLDKGVYFGRRLQGEFLINEKTLSAEDKKEIMSWDCRPSATIENGRVKLRHCVFSPFLGFFLSEVTVVFEPELKLLMPPVKLKTMPYNCGIRY